MRGNIFSPESVLSNAMSLLLLILALKRPVTGRSLMSILFTGAACFNGYMAITHPRAYMVYAELAALPAYETFIRGTFSRHISSFILMIATAQLATGIFIAGSGMLARLALAGAIIFLLAIAPLGAGSAFPCTVVLAAACAVLLIKGQPETLITIIGRKFWNRPSI